MAAANRGNLGVIDARPEPRARPRPGAGRDIVPPLSAIAVRHRLTGRTTRKEGSRWSRYTSRLTSRTMAFVLAGGRGSRLKELTDRRAKPAVYFGGKTRIIDFALSNALNSGIRKIAVATQYKAHSLIRHLQRGWNFFRAERNEYLDILPASQRVDEGKWYLGTADAVTQNIDIVDSYDVDYIMILAGDHIYKMDYEMMLREHVGSGADVTVGCLDVPREEARPSASWMWTRPAGSSTFWKTRRSARHARRPGTSRWPRWASMSSAGGSCANLLRADAEDPNSSHDFGHDLIPHIVKNGKAMAHRFAESCVRAVPKPRPIGAMSARSTRSGRPIST
jgi:glucose-1-phosphate adenylyltransferase